ncbi:MAG: hypothetical protein ACYC7D_06140 [Nitrososphaerales archaeon]
MTAVLLLSIGAFLLAFKAVLVEGSEVAILSLATIKQIGRDNVLLGVSLGGLGSVVTFLVVRQVFLFFPDYVIDLGTGAIILYFSYRFLRGFVKYYFKGKSFRAKMEKWSAEVIAKDRKHEQQASGVIQFSFANSIPVLSITLTEGLEASLVIAAGGVFNFGAAVLGALVSIVVLVAVCAISYDYLMRVPRWLLDLIAGGVLLAFGLFFLGSGILLVV